MTAVDTVPARTAPAPAAATRALLAAEARLAARSRLVWASAALALGLGLAWGWTRMLTWDTFGENAGMAALVLAGGFLLVGHLAAGRDHRHGAAETLRVVPAPADRRSLALLAYLPVAALAGALVTGLHLLLLAPHFPVGQFQLSRLLVPVVVPALGAVTGVAVGRRLPRTAVGPLALVTAAVLVMSMPIVGNGSSFVGWWLAPVVLRENWAPGAPQPHGWHLVYLLALLAAGAALVPLRRRRLRWAAAAAACLAVAAGAVIPQATAAPQTVTAELMDRYTGPDTMQCASHSGVRYCALRGFGGWLPLWREAVEPVVAALPGPARQRLPEVRQHPDMSFGTRGPADPRVVDTGLVWGRHGDWAARSRASLTAAYATAVVLPPPVPRTEPSATGEPFVGCSGAGQARTVVALWLAAQALPDGARRLAQRELSLGPVRYGAPEAAAAATLLALPRQRVTGLLAANWAAVTAAPTGADVLAPLGVTGLVAPAGGEPCR